MTVQQFYFKEGADNTFAKKDLSDPETQEVIETKIEAYVASNGLDGGTP